MLHLLKIRVGDGKHIDCDYGAWLTGRRVATLLPCFRAALWGTLGPPSGTVTVGAGRREGKRDGTNQLPRLGESPLLLLPALFQASSAGRYSRYCEQCSIHDPLSTSRKLAPPRQRQGFGGVGCFSAPPHDPVRLQMYWLVVRKHERFARIRLADDAPCSCRETCPTLFFLQQQRRRRSNNDRGIQGLYEWRQATLAANSSLLHRSLLRTTAYKYASSRLRIDFVDAPDGCFDSARGGGIGTKAGLHDID